MMCTMPKALYRRYIMTTPKRSPNPQRVAFLRALPLEIKETITGEEAEVFMFEEEIPESLYLKIKDFLEEGEEPA